MSDLAKWAEACEPEPMIPPVLSGRSNQERQQYEHRRAAAAFLRRLAALTEGDHSAVAYEICAREYGGCGCKDEGMKACGSMRESAEAAVAALLELCATKGETT